MLIKRLKRKNNSDKSSASTEFLIEKCPICYIPCDAIRSNAFRPRFVFDEDKLINLAYSIKCYGIIEPLCVRKTDAEDSYDFELVSGERRLRAAKLAGLTSVPCYITDVSQELSSELSITENISSEPLNYFELAVALKRLIDLGADIEDLSLRLLLSQGDITKKLWLLELSYEERQRLLSFGVSEKNAILVAQISDKARRVSVIDHICAQNMSDGSISEYLESISEVSAESAPTSSESYKKLPRDVRSAIKGITSRISLLNRHKKRADLILKRDGNVIVAEIRISLNGD